MGLILGGASASDLILDGKSVSLYVGGNPPTKVWPTRETVQITLGATTQARDQLRAALADRGLNYQTVEEIPFEIELVGTGSTNYMFYGCSSLTSVPVMDTSSVTNMSFMFSLCPLLTTVPDMDTSQVTNMNAMFYECASLTHVPDMDTSSVTNMSFMFDACPSLTHVPDMATGQVTDMRYMLQNCSALTDGNVRLIGRNPDVDTTGMIDGSGLTREPFYTTDGQPWPTAEVHEVTLTDVTDGNKVHPLVTVTVPAGEAWSVRIQGTVTKAADLSSSYPFFRIGATDSGTYGPGASVDVSGTVTSADTTIAMVTRGYGPANAASFVGTVTIEK